MGSVGPPGPRGPAGEQGSGSIAIPILLIVLVLAIVVSLVREQVLTNKNGKTTSQLAKTTNALRIAVSTLHATDTIACSFIVADANTRTQQAVNSSLLLGAQQDYTATTRRLLVLFGRTVPKATKAQKASQKLLTDYLAAQVKLSTVTSTQTSKNIVLTQTLAATASDLAATLPCPDPIPPPPSRR